MKSLPLIRAGLAVFLFCSVSCERQKQLLRESERLEAEYQRTVDEIQLIEQRILSLGTQVATASVNLQRQAAVAEQKAAALEIEVGTLEAKAQAFLKAKEEFAPRVDAYKAKYLR